MSDEGIIGIVGGVGPYAGLDLARKILNETKAKRDQDHLSIALLSFPEEIEDRTSFLSHQTNINPAYAIFSIIRKLEKLGAKVVGIPCNTAHAPPIFDLIVENLEKANSDVKLVHMIVEVARFIKKKHRRIQNVGVLSTTGTYKTKVYPNILEGEGFTVILPDEDVQENIVHRSIYDPINGIKAQSDPVSEFAKGKLRESIDHLQKKGAEAIILGCTEISMAVQDRIIRKNIIIDPSLILARALIREANPEKLKPLRNNLS